MDKFASMTPKSSVMPGMGDGIYAQTTALSSKKMRKFSKVNGGVVMPDWGKSAKANKTLKRYSNKYPSGSVSNLLSSKMISKSGALSKSPHRFNALFDVHVKDVNKLTAAMDQIEVRKFIEAAQPINDTYLKQVNQSGALADSFGLWKTLAPNQLDFLDEIGSIELGIEKSGLNPDSSVVSTITPDNFRSAAGISITETIDDGNSYTPTDEEKFDAVSAIQNNNVDKLPSKLKQWTVCLVIGLLKFLIIKLVVTTVCATPVGSNWLYATEHVIPNEAYSRVEQSRGKSLGNNYFMKVNTDTPVRIAAKKSSSKIIAYLTKGDTIRACERKGKWIRVEIRDTQTFYGWASQSSVTHINLKGE